MSEFEPVSTVQDLKLLDETDMMNGYLSGFHGDPIPGSDKSRSFWHGWRNGQVDGGFAKSDDAQRSLVRGLMIKQRAH
jgi:hypothetical protein